VNSTLRARIEPDTVFYGPMRLPYFRTAAAAATLVASAFAQTPNGPVPMPVPVPVSPPTTDPAAAAHPSSLGPDAETSSAAHSTAPGSPTSVATSTSATVPDARSFPRLFLRAAIGVGYMINSTVWEGSRFLGGVDASGGAAAFEVDIGSAVRPGFVVAGSFSIQGINDASITNDTRTVRYPRHDPRLWMVAVMLDVYPGTQRSFHLGGSLGFSALQISENSDVPAAMIAAAPIGTGFAVAPHIGYEWLVDNDWTGGVVCRFLYGRTEGDFAGDGVETDNVRGAVMMVSVTYN
jgi:hypothetical protein